MSMKAEEFGIALDAQASAELAKRSTTSRRRATCSRPPTPRSSCSCAGPPAGTRTTSGVESYRVSSYHREGPGRSSPASTASIELTNEATVKVWIGDDRRIAVGEGNGPVNALDQALRRALNGHFPALARIHLVDYRVRVLDTAVGTEAVTRVLIESSDGDGSWFTVGVSENVIEASWIALIDAIVYGLLHTES